MRLVAAHAGTMSCRNSPTPRSFTALTYADIEQPAIEFTTAPYDRTQYNYVLIAIKQICPAQAAAQKVAQTQSRGIDVE